MKFLVPLLVIFFVANAYSQEFKEIYNYSNFGAGHGVAVDDNIIVVGQPKDNYDSIGQNLLFQTGSVLIYQFDSIEGVNLIQKINAKTRKDGAHFGSSVAIRDSILVVASIDDDTTGSGSRGSICIFKMNAQKKWVQMQQFRASDWQDSKKFGYDVAVGNDGWVMVTDPEHQNGFIPGNNRGKIYVYKKNSGGIFTEVQNITYPYIAANVARKLGYSIAIHNNETIIGAPLDETIKGGVVATGAAYIFELVGSTWQEKVRLDGWNNNHTYAYFGYSVDISQDRLIIGASEDNNINEVGGPIPNSGAAYIYKKASSGNWVQDARLIASNYSLSNLRFGSAVAISGDNALVMSNKYGVNLYGKTCYFFKRIGNSWTEMQKIELGTNASPLSDPQCVLESPLAVVGTEDVSTFRVYFNCVRNSYNVNKTICVGDSVFLEGEYRKNNGTYTDTFLSKFSCDSIVTTQLIVTFDQLNLTLTASNGQTITVNTDSALYQWLECPLMAPIVGETNKSYKPVTNGSYAVAVSNNSCTDTSECIDVRAVGTSELMSYNSISISPNPASDILLISADFQVNAIEFIDLNGKVVSRKMVLEKGEIMLDVSQLDPAFYLIRVYTTKEVIDRKVLIE